MGCKNRKPKIVIKTRNGGYTKIYANRKWQERVTEIKFHGCVENHEIVIECEFKKIKCNKNGVPIVSNNELAIEKHIVR